MKSNQKVKKFLCALLGLTLALGIFSACGKDKNEESTGEKDKPDTAVYKTGVVSNEIVGSGGYGAVFEAKIDPYNKHNLAALCDMGCLYFSYDEGKSWSRHDIMGTLFALEYDQSKDGVVWAAGSGVYKSTDHGKTVEMVLPKADEVTSYGNNYENINNWLYTDAVKDSAGKPSAYAPQYQIHSIAINRKNSDNVYVGQRVPAAGFGFPAGIRIYETDDGNNFRYFTTLEYSFNYKLEYDEKYDCLVMITPEKIIEVDKSGEVVWQKEMATFVHHSNGNVLAFDSAYDCETGKNTFVISSPRTLSSEGGGDYDDHVNTALYITDDLRNDAAYVDVMRALASETVKDLGIEDSRTPDYKSYEYDEWITSFEKHEFPWTAANVHAMADGAVYFANDVVITKSNGVERRIPAYIKYDPALGDHKFRWVYGFPHKPYDKYIVNKSWQDGDSGYCYGICSTMQAPDALVFSTMTGTYFTPDGQNFYQCNSNIITKDITLTAKRKDGYTQDITGVIATSTTGMDVYCTHRVATDPFDENHVLIASTDFGLLQSFDAGKSWIRLVREWNGDSVKHTYADYFNTCYDLHFDKERQGVVYAIWSRIQTAPYAPSTKYMQSSCRFAISYDGGTSWTFSNLTPDGKGMPYRMYVDYEGKNRTIYVATCSDGFFVSKNLGESWESMNEGIPVSGYKGLSGIFANEIIKCKQGLFAITGAAADYPDDQKFYKRNESENRWEEIPLPKVTLDGAEYSPAAIRDIEYDEKNDCIYLAAIATSVTNYNSLVKTAGGVYKYKDGQFTQIYDDKVSVFGVNLDSSGRLYATVLDGAVVRFDENNTKYETLISGLFHRPKNISFGPTDDILYLTTWGGGTYKMKLGKVKA